MEASSQSTSPPAAVRPSWWAEKADQPAGIARLTIKVVSCWFTPPFYWWREAFGQAWVLIRRCAIPTVISLFAFGYGAPGIQSTSIGERLRFVHRGGGGFFV